MADFEKAVQLIKLYLFLCIFMSMKRINRIGQKYGRLTVTDCEGKKEVYGRERLLWKCKCDCGSEVIASSDQLSAGLVSCGCIKIEIIGALRRTHGRSKTKEHRAWCKMKSRCYTVTDSKYDQYGKRGIEVCDRWKHSFDAFIFDMGLSPSAKHSIERIDVNGHYTPSNCKWGTDEEQRNNKQDTIRVPFNGKILSLKQWCNVNSLPYKTVHSMYRYKNKSFNQILSEYGRL